MSFSKLPEEVVDAICEQVYTFKREFGSETLRRLCLVSRQTLGAARRWLYRTPFRSLNLTTHRHRLLSLRRTLTENPQRAREVRRFSGLARSVRYFAADYPPSNDSSGSEQAVEPWSWQDDILALCPRLFEVSLYLRDEQHAAALAGRVAANSDLTRIELISGARADLFRRWITVFEQYSNRPLLHLILHLCECVHEQAQRSEYAPRSLKIVLGLLPSPCPVSALAFFPKHLPDLEDLRIHARSLYNSATFVAFFAALAGNALSRFDFVNPSIRFNNDAPPRLETYVYWAVGGSSGALPPAAFTAFPHARRLAFTNQPEMSLDKLSLLADTSSSLARVDLSGSYWTFTPADFIRSSSPSSQAASTPSSSAASTSASSASTSSLSSGEDRLIAVLRRMPRLQVVKLGVLPFDKDSERLSGLEEYCSGRGLRLEVEGCTA
ncbi:hypothetical protein JCM6882_008505 [Rhodosporidiobolus microsporus]